MHNNCTDVSEGDMATDTFWGIEIQLTTLDDAVDEFLKRVAAGDRPESYRLVNAYTLALASKRLDYQALLHGQGINLPDGKPLAAIMNRLSHGQCEQVRGPSFFEHCIDKGRDLGIRHFLLGASTATLKSLTQALEGRYPGVRIAGTHSPPFQPFTPEDTRKHDMLIQNSGADVVWVGIGTPRQDFEARRLTDSTGVTSAAVGAAFDFSAGVKRQAPRLMHRLNLEWLYRLATEPRRLGRRYVEGNTIFLRLALREFQQRRREAASLRR